MPDLVVVGIGNPAPAYANTRHNAGVMLVERLASVMGVTLKRGRNQLRSAEGSLEDHAVVLGVPTTFMNESGRPVGALVRKTGIRPPKLLVAHDELDIPLGRIRLKVGGGTAGHNGIKSICASLRSNDFLRIRIGIGRPEVGSDATDKVLSKFRPEERDVIDRVLDRSVEGIRVLLRDGVDAAQTFLHAPAPGDGR